MKYPSEYIVWDLETSGLSKNFNKIIEIGAMKVSNGNKVSTFEKILNHNIEIPELIVELTGITKDFIDKEGEDPEKVLKQFVGLIMSVGMNISHNGFKFDIPFLVEAVKPYYNEEEIKSLRMHLYNTFYDTAVCYKARKMGEEIMFNEHFGNFSTRIMNQRIKGLKFNVGIACDELGIDKTKVTQHRAIGDVELTHEIFKKIS